MNIRYCQYNCIETYISAIKGVWCGRQRGYATGIGRSKKEAEQEAARYTLASLITEP